MQNVKMWFSADNMTQYSEDLITGRTFKRIRNPHTMAFGTWKRCPKPQ